MPITAVLGFVLYGSLVLLPVMFVGFGLLLGAVTSVWLSRMSLAAGYWDLFWPQLFQGFALGLLFVPLTTITMAPISRETMGNAASLFNLMRNQAGGIGIAFVTTMLARRRAFHTAVLTTHVSMYGGAGPGQIESIRNALVARGMDAVTALDRARASIAGMIARQAATLSFIDLAAGDVLPGDDPVALLHAPARAC